MSASTLILPPWSSSPFTDTAVHPRLMGEANQPIDRATIVYHTRVLIDSNINIKSAITYIDI